ncbi:hypothetical protein ABZS79_02845 [Streptomyces griseoloalbus]|uniref:hypothetical protein n=1 Tax=Streptomyces griseoloalbus TaxID=67303 RepID=UPI0033ABD0B3
MVLPADSARPPTRLLGLWPVLPGPVEVAFAPGPAGRAEQAGHAGAAPPSRGAGRDARPGARHFTRPG